MSEAPEKQLRKDAGVSGAPPGEGHVFHYFSELLKRPVRTEDARRPVGHVSDLVFKQTDPFPEAVGITMRYGWGRKPTQFVPWDRVIRIAPEAIFVRPPEAGQDYPPFVDQPGWILLDEHLMGRTILEIDGRKTEVVNDVQLLEAKNRLLLVHVDGSLNGILRRWGLRRLIWRPDDLISWKFVQPFSVEDAVASDRVTLSVTREQLTTLPGEDLADALEELSGEEQEALFSALNSEKAAETLSEAEPRAQRQLVANLREGRARGILSEMTVAQIADMLSILPHDHTEEMLKLLPAERRDRVQSILSELEVPASTLASRKYHAMAAATTVGEAIARLRASKNDPEAISYVYVVREPGQTLEGVVDSRQLLLSPDSERLSEIMTSPVVSADDDDTRDVLAEIFAKYRYRLLPVVDREHRMVGVVRYNDILKGPQARGRE